MFSYIVRTPKDNIGDIIWDLNSRRGQVSEMNQRGNAKEIAAMVPLANIFGYVNSLRSMSQGRAQFLWFLITMIKCHNRLMMKLRKIYHKMINDCYCFFME